MSFFIIFVTKLKLTNSHNLMKSISRLFLLECLTILAVANAKAQSASSLALEAMRSDYPGLMSLYGDKITGQKAHYVFVIDVSSSMLNYESTVKHNLLQFLDAVPDGDQVSIIQMADENNTKYLENIKCAALSPSIRSGITEAVNALHFNRSGAREDGSDGFTMTKTVIDAINQVGSNDLTFVYMLTDFEYWTHKNGFNKDREDWASLKSALPASKVSGMCKYGIELKTNATLRQSAIFKRELDEIFGKVEYQSVGSAALLANWFSHVATSVMAVKLNSLLKSDWEVVEQSLVSTVSSRNDEIRYDLQGVSTPLVNGATVVFKTDCNQFSPVESEGPFPGTITVGKLDQPSDQKTFLPSYAKLGGDSYEAELKLESPYAEEISRLQGVCGEVAGQGDAVTLTRQETGVLPSSRVWNSTLPMWVWILIFLIILVIIASFIYEYAFIKLNRDWSVSIKAIAPDGSSARYNNDAIKASFTFGPSDSAIPVKGAPWAIKLYSVRHNPLTFLKSGYWLTLEQGTFADVEIDGDEPKTLSIGDKIFICKAGSAAVVDIRIKEKGKTDYKISLN